MKGLTSANLWIQRFDSRIACNVLVIAAGRIASRERFLPLHTRVCARARARAHTRRLAGVGRLYAAATPGRRGVRRTTCLPNLGVHKAGIPSLCNDKLGVRFVKANWMRLLAYIVSTVQYSKCTNSQVHPRARAFAIHRPGYRSSSSSSTTTTATTFPPGTPVQESSYRSFCRERSDCWTLIEFPRHRTRSAMPAKSNLPYARDKYDEGKIFAIFFS